MRTSSIGLFSVIILAFSVIFTGCATISNGPKQEISLTTSTGKSVVADIGGSKVNIPGKVKISRAKGAVVQVRAEDNPGYETTQLVISGKNKTSGWFWLNIIWGGTFGSTTDAATGGMYEYANPNFTIPVSQK